MKAKVIIQILSTGQTINAYFRKVEEAESFAGMFEEINKRKVKYNVEVKY